MNILRKTAFAAGFSLISSVALSAAGHAEIVVGVTISLSGPGAGLGVSLQRGFLLNPKTIGSEPVRYVILDDASDPSAAVRNIRKLATEEHVDVLMGPAIAPVGFAMAPVLTELEIPLISAAPIDLVGDKAQWFANTTPSNDDWVDTAVQHMKKTGIKKIAYIGFSDTFGDQMFSSLKVLTPKAGIEIVADERFARSDTTVAGQVLRIIAAKPDAVFVGASASPAVLPNVTLRERGYDKPLYNSPVAVFPAFMRLGGAKVEGALASSFLTPVASQLPDSNPSKAIAMKLDGLIRAAYPDVEPDGQISQAYDSAIILDKIAPAALQKAKPGTKEFRHALRDELFKVRELPGSRGIYNFKQGQPYGLDSRATVMVAVKDGKWLLLPQ